LPLQTLKLPAHFPDQSVIFPLAIAVDGAKQAGKSCNLRSPLVARGLL
jgi:hypothetical protein